jgi:hypothetical protein
MSKADGTQIVEAENVVGVSVSVKDCIEMSDVLADCLLAKVRSRINQNVAIVVLNENRRASAPVMRVL